METFTASDLSRRRKDVLAASRHDGALVRDTEGTVHAMVPFERLAVSERLNELASTLAALVGSLDVDDTRASSLGEAGWAAPWPKERRRQLAEDLGEALALSMSTKDPRPAEALLTAMRPRPPHSSGRFDVAATWTGLSSEDQLFLTSPGRRRRRQASKTQ